MRTIIDLREDQLAELDGIVAVERVSRAEAIRNAVDAYLQQRKTAEADRITAIDEAFGLWKDHDVDTDTYLNELRAEWDR
ncbi:MAG: ribbon-helix-helix protein, CopG family [Gammaproteobacteria bacterium]